MSLIEGVDALAEFRASLDGRRGLDLLREYRRRALIQLPVGVGKSRLLDEVTIEALACGDHDLVVVLAPTRQLIEERMPLRAPPNGLKIVNLRPRPVDRCGKERDARWQKFEAADLGALGRAEICATCPQAGGCYWPDQYGRGLEGAAIVYATHAHMERSPGFLSSVRNWVKAERPLTLIDEFDFAAKDYGIWVPSVDLARFAGALEASAAECAESAWDHKGWTDLVSMLRGASTCDLQDSNWSMPRIHHEWAAKVQRAGVEAYGDDFRFPAYRLADLGRSPIETRRKGWDGGIEFATRPYIGDCLIFTGTASLSFARYRLGQDFGSPFADHRFSHPGTHWSNIASPIGASHYFGGNSDRILDFFAMLTIRRLAEGKRVLMVSKKLHMKRCQDGLASRFVRAGVDLEVLADGFSEERLVGPRVVPLINYGMIGTNLFEEFDSAYCLNSYYIDEPVLDHCLQDLTRGDLRLPTRIETVGNPRRRRAGVANPAHLDYDIARLAQPALEFKEHGVVVQAVGRVRPFTRPREVITFQMAELPGVGYDAEFQTLGEARRYFDIPTGSQRKTNDLAARIATLRGQGLSQVEAAAILGVSERTIRNYEHKGGPAKGHL